MRLLNKKLSKEIMNAENELQPLHKMARLRPRASAVLEFIDSTTLCLTFFKTGNKVCFVCLLDDGNGHYKFSHIK